MLETAEKRDAFFLLLMTTRVVDVARGADADSALTAISAESLGAGHYLFRRSGRRARLRYLEAWYDQLADLSDGRADGGWSIADSAPSFDHLLRRARRGLENFDPEELDLVASSLSRLVKAEGGATASGQRLFRGLFGDKASVFPRLRECLLRSSGVAEDAPAAASAPVSESAAGAVASSFEIPGQSTIAVGPIEERPDPRPSDRPDIEVEFSPEARLLESQIDEEIGLIERVSALEEKGGFVRHIPLEDRCEYVVVGDLHGSYSCLKSVLDDTDLESALAKGAARLICLGDYVDRGFRALEGVLRALLRLKEKYPDRVTMLRGNHELFFEAEDGLVRSRVSPSDTLDGWRGLLPERLFKAYAGYFGKLPVAAFVGEVAFIHGGLPTEDNMGSVSSRASLGEREEIREQILWSDPVAFDIRASVQRMMYERDKRFPFGPAQFRSFMRRIEAVVLVRAHEAIEEGFRESFEGTGARLLTIFSCGGAACEFREDSPYRRISPKYLVMDIARATDGAVAYRFHPRFVRTGPYQDGGGNRLARAVAADSAGGSATDGGTGV